ncbi:TerB family tellurite resistance protein [Temperatibacter marinus]|uniref:TerB family tellurite resistance protein n=1 Tax=Temperatibacter marinus TaxID=1456591 RepID=A0AA52EEX1_9PROT|nr:TerB family tellurite resistance protein [Temperatibacter marinus]WND01555.1 TerB family tellurite resistance protein [Temperatibacter marinus]
MSVWGKIIGGTAGLAIGGPIGALIGVGIGAAVDASAERLLEDPQAKRRVTFTIGVIALAAKMAKADGRVTREEVDAFKAVFHFDQSEMKNVGKIFDLARQSTAGYEAYAKQIAGLMKGHPSALEDLLEALFYIAKSDGTVHPKELEFIRSVSSIFGFDDSWFEALQQRHTGQSSDNPYVVLGVDHSISDKDLKSHYRKLVKENHPDRLIAEGVPSEFIAVATRRVAEINAAYDTIKQERGLKS